MPEPLGLISCGGSKCFKKQTAGAWPVTYEVTLEGRGNSKLAGVSYLDAPSRGESSSNVPVGEAATTHTAGNAAKAACRNLLDGEREIAAQTGALARQAAAPRTIAPWATTVFTSDRAEAFSSGLEPSSTRSATPWRTSLPTPR